MEVIYIQFREELKFVENTTTLTCLSWFRYQSLEEPEAGTGSIKEQRDRCSVLVVWSEEMVLADGQADGVGWN